MGTSGYTKECPINLPNLCLFTLKPYRDSEISHPLNRGCATLGWGSKSGSSKHIVLTTSIVSYRGVCKFLQVKTGYY